MKALWLENKKLIFRDDLPIPEPSVNEVLIKVISAGICATDLELLDGYYPFTGIPGHEFVGLVIMSPSDPYWLNKRVVGEINISCKECDSCIRGDHNHCEKRKVLGIKEKNGAFAEYLILPISNIHEIPDSIPNDKAVFIEPIAAAVRILEQVNIILTDKVLIIGAGRLGQLIARVFQNENYDVQVLAKYSDQIKLLKNLGIHTISESDAHTKKFDVVVEASGSEKGIDYALRAVRSRGIVVMKTTTAETVSVNMSQIVVNEVTIIGSRCGPFKPALELLVNENINPIPMISARYPIDSGILGFQHADKPGVMKIIIDFP